MLKCLVALLTFFVFACAVVDPRSVAHAAGGAVEDQQEYLQRAKGMPAEVQKWLARAIECYNLKGEPAYDPQRKKFIKARLRESRCTHVQRDGSRLTKKYHKKAAVVSAIEEAKRDYGKKQKPIRN